MSILRRCVAAMGGRRLAVLVAVPVCVFLIFKVLTAIQAAREAARRFETKPYGGDPVEDTKTLLAMRAKFPVVSLGDRLSYESPADSSDDDQVTSLSGDAEQLLNHFDESAEQNERRWMLARLHDESFAEFVEQSGFGRGRMWRPLRWETIVLHEPRLVPLPQPLPESKPFTFIDSATVRSDDDIAPTVELTNLHNDRYFDFVNPTSFGAVVLFGQVSSTDSARSPFAIRQVLKVRSNLPADSLRGPLSIGFISHGMTSDHDRSIQGRQSEWQILKLELVSMLKFREPRVYVSTHLPNMEELKSAKTRPIERFERRALQQLRNGEDIVVESRANLIRMVGAVRAAKQCLDCHSVRRGDLLGAFSYSLDRNLPNPEG